MLFQPLEQREPQRVARLQAGDRVGSEAGREGDGDRQREREREREREGERERETSDAMSG